MDDHYKAKECLKFIDDMDIRMLMVGKSTDQKPCYLIFNFLYITTSLWCTQIAHRSPFQYKSQIWSYWLFIIKIRWSCYRLSFIMGIHIQVRRCLYVETVNTWCDQRMYNRVMHQRYIRLWLKCRHNERECVSNHRGLDYLLSSSFSRRSKKTSKLRVTGLCEGNSPVTGEFPSQITRNAENVSIRWRHHCWWKESQKPCFIETVSPEGTFCDTVQIPSSVGDMELI